MTKQDLWKQAESFIELHKKILLKKIKKYKVYSTGLETKDFLQEAIIIAFETAKETYEKYCQTCKFYKKANCDCVMSKCINYKKIFWGKLKNRFYQSDLTDNPSEYRLYKHCSKQNNLNELSRKPFKRLSIEEEFQEYDYDAVLISYETTPEDICLKNEKRKSFNAAKKELREILLKFFTQKEKEIYSLLETGETIDGIAQKMGYKHKNAVYITLKRMQEKAERIREKINSTAKQLYLYH